MDFNFWFEMLDWLVRVGIDKIGIGVLIGLEDWRIDCFYVVVYFDYLEKIYW